MGMTNEEIAELLASSDIESEEVKANDKTETPKGINPPSTTQTPKTEDYTEETFISQDIMDSLLSDFVAEDNETQHSDLIDEIHEAILDSGKLSLMQWIKLREKLREIEQLIPHIDLIIRLKSKHQDKLTEEERNAL